MTTAFCAIAGAASEADRIGRPQPQALAELRTSGLLGLNIPAQFGGRGCDALRCNRTLAELARCDSSCAIVLFQHLSTVSRLLERGTEEQKDRFLPPMAAGRMVAASAWSEKGAGAAKQRLSTVAVREPGGWLLNGAKTFTTGAGLAGVYLILVKTSDEEPRTARYGAGGQTFFLVEASRPGVIPKTDLELTGMRGSSTGFVELQDCRVPDDNVLGPVGGAADVIADVRQSGLTLGAVSVGIAEAAIDIGRQSSRKLSPGTPQRVRTDYLLAQLESRVRAARALVERAGRREPETVGVDTLAAKVFASETSEVVCREVQQLMGGSGFIRGTTIDRLSRDARAVALMGPVNDLALDLITEELTRE